MSAATIRSVLKAAARGKSDQIFKTQAGIFEDELLHVSSFPEEYVDLFVDIVSSDKFFESEGAAHFVPVVLSDQHKLSENQLRRILNAFLLGFPRYSDETLCLTVCDFIATAYAPEMAIDAFGKLAASSTRKEALVAILVGLEILLKKVSEEPVLREKVKDLHLQVQRKFPDS